MISYRDTLQKMGIGFVFIPVPNKENIYHQLLPSKRRPVFLEELLERLQAADVLVVDLQEPFDSAHAAGVRLYPKDDNHWSPEAVEIAAAKTRQVIGYLEEQKNPLVRPVGLNRLPCKKTH